MQSRTETSTNVTERPVLRRGIGTFGFFALAFGSMIGVGWVTALGNWLKLGGPCGAMAAFLVGGLFMMLIGLCYAELTPMLPVAGGEVAYAYRASGTRKAFLVGWLLAFGYLSVSAFEAISVGWVLSMLFPAIDRWPVWEIGGETVYATHLLIATLLTGAVTFVNFRGVGWASKVQSVLTAIFVLITMTLVVAGLLMGEWHHVVDQPFAAEGGAAFAGFGAVLVTAPFWFVGFDTIPQGAEESNLELPPRRLGALILVSILCAAAFYVVLLLSVSMTGPWSELVTSKLPTATAFERVFEKDWLVDLVLFAALLGLLTSWNGFFLAGSRVIFALGRGRMIPARFGTTHAKYGTPAFAVLFSGLVTLAGAFLGRGATMAFVNVGSLCIAGAFFGVTHATMKLRRVAPELDRPVRLPGGATIPVLAMMGSGGILLALLIPSSPVALSKTLEWSILAAVIVLGIGAWMIGSKPRAKCSEVERARLVLGAYADS